MSKTVWMSEREFTLWLLASQLIGMLEAECGSATAEGFANRLNSIAEKLHDDMGGEAQGGC